jgi:putative protein kinase ArgK-like GTPase of G3E family
VLDRLLDAVRGGKGRALVVRGEPGVGKTALLEYLVEHASGCQVAQVAVLDVSGTDGPQGAGRTIGGRLRSPPDRFKARRWASFVGPLRVE